MNKRVLFSIIAGSVLLIGRNICSMQSRVTVSPFHDALEKNDYEEVIRLSHVSRRNINVRDERGMPLEFALRKAPAKDSNVRNRYQTMISYLLVGGAIITSSAIQMLQQDEMEDILGEVKRHFSWKKGISDLPIGSFERRVHSLSLKDNIMKKYD